LLPVVGVAVTVVEAEVEAEFNMIVLMLYRLAVMT
jgi:hypothetical protein